MTIDWIRHTSLLISGEICYGQTDINVSPTFEKEAIEVRKKLYGKQYTAVFASPLRRAKMLATFCGYTPIIHPAVQERNFGLWEMKPWREIFASLEESDFPELVTPPQGESVETFKKRIESFISELKMKYEKEAYIALFCHGGVINVARQLQGQIAEELLFREVPDYGSITTLSYE